MIGSGSDIPQTSPGVRLLKHTIDYGLIIFDGIQIASIHRNQDEVKTILGKWVNEDEADIILLCAGAANQLTGCG